MGWPILNRKPDIARWEPYWQDQRSVVPSKSWPNGVVWMKTQVVSCIGLSALVVGLGSWQDPEPVADFRKTAEAFELSPTDNES